MRYFEFSKSSRMLFLLSKYTHCIVGILCIGYNENHAYKNVVYVQTDIVIITHTVHKFSHVIVDQTSCSLSFFSGLAKLR